MARFQNLVEDTQIEIRRVCILQMEREYRATNLWHYSYWVSRLEDTFFPYAEDLGLEKDFLDRMEDNLKLYREWERKHQDYEYVLNEQGTGPRIDSRNSIYENKSMLRLFLELKKLKEHYRHLKDYLAEVKTKFISVQNTIYISQATKNLIDDRDQENNTIALKTLKKENEIFEILDSYVHDEDFISPELKTQFISLKQTTYISAATKQMIDSDHKNNTITLRTLRKENEMFEDLDVWFNDEDFNLREVVLD